MAEEIRPAYPALGRHGCGALPPSHTLPGAMRITIIPLVGALLLTACSAPADAPSTPAEEAPAAGGQASVQDDDSQKDVVKVAVGSKDHTTLVAAVKAADLVNSLANAGPFTVFAPTNAAFDRLPAGALDDLMKPENAGKLGGILQHHVAVPVYDEESLEDGLVLGMADGGKVTITRKGTDTFVDGAKILGAVRASNGIVYVVDAVILPRG